jgi:hypothetical protein
MLDGLFQKVSRVDFSICSNLVEKRSERMVVVVYGFPPSLRLKEPQTKPTSLIPTERLQEISWHY